MAMRIRGTERLIHAEMTGVRYASMGFVVVAHWCVGTKRPPSLRTQHLKRSTLFGAVFCELSESFFNAVRVENLILLILY